MAMSSGKMVVMGMVIGWQVLNKLANPQDARSEKAIDKKRKQRYNK